MISGRKMKQDKPKSIKKKTYENEKSRGREKKNNE